MKLISLIGVLLLANLSYAQVALPYTTGFDNAAEQDGWKEYNLVTPFLSHWVISTIGSSEPSSIGHDFSPSSGIGITDNWYVSPGFEIKNGGTLEAISYLFSGFSVPGDGDTIAIYLLQGDQDPVLANRTLLFDFRGDEYNADNTYRDLSSIELSKYDELSYLAVRYRNNDNSSNWLNVHFDDITINKIPLGFSEDKIASGEINVFPNPATNEIVIENELLNINRVKLIDNLGVCHIDRDIRTEGVTIDLSKLYSGVYHMVVYTDNGVTSKEVIVQR